ncbi:hypothetical protein V1524DRAFT_450372 [Lipomyces starkeyi]
MVNHEPPVFCIGFALGRIAMKDTLSNILETRQLTLNVISEWFVEAANFTSTNPPKEISEWDLSGLTQSPSIKVKPAQVAESVFSAEFQTSVTGKVTGMLCVVEGVQFHVYEEGLNEKKNAIDPGFLKPVSRLGGVTYSRSICGYELTRPEWTDICDSDEVRKVLDN